MRVLVRLVEQLVARDDRVQQPHLVRALRRDEICAQQELHRLRERDLARQAHGSATAREQPTLGLHHRELSFRARDTDVDATQHLHSTCGTEAVDGRDDRLPDLRPPQHGLRAVVEPVAVDLAQPFLLDALGDFGDLGDVRLEIRAGEERVADAGDDRDPRPLVLVEALPRHPELLEVLHVGRVPRLGPVDRDAGDVLVVPLVVDGHGRLPAYLANLTR